MPTQVSNNIEYRLNFSTSVFWNFTFNGMKLAAEKKKNKHGLLMEKVYVYTKNSGGGDYYNTTAFAIFSSTFHFEKVFGVKLTSEDEHTEACYEYNAKYEHDTPGECICDE